MNDTLHERAEDAVEEVIAEVSEERAAEAVIEARADERQAALETRLAALESQRSEPSPSVTDESIGAMIERTLAPLSERITALETTMTAPPLAPPPEPETDPFAPQVDLAAMARVSDERMPHITHPLFRRLRR